MPDYANLKPIYQYYVDALQGRARAQQIPTETQLERIETGMKLFALNQTIQEQQIARQIWGEGGSQQQQPGVFDKSAAGGSTPNANPSTGQDPSLQTAARMDRMGQELMKINPLKSQEWFTKASTLRDQYYTRQKNQLEIQTRAADQVGKIFGS